MRSLAFGGCLANISSCHFEELRRFEVRVLVGLRKKEEVDFFCGKERERWMDGFIGERMGEVNIEMF